MSERKAWDLEDEATAIIKEAKGEGQTLRKTWGILDNGTQVRLSFYEVTFTDLMSQTAPTGAARFLVAQLAEVS